MNSEPSFFEPRGIHTTIMASEIYRWDLRSFHRRISGVRCLHSMPRESPWKFLRVVRYGVRTDGFCSCCFLSVSEFWRFGTFWSRGPPRMSTRTPQCTRIFCCCRWYRRWCHHVLSLFIVMSWMHEGSFVGSLAARLLTADTSTRYSTYLVSAYCLHSAGLVSFDACPCKYKLLHSLIYQVLNCTAVQAFPPECLWPFDARNPVGVAVARWKGETKQGVPMWHDDDVRGWVVFGFY